MASKKETPNIDNSMLSMDDNYKNNKLPEFEKPLILTKEHNSQKEETSKNNDLIKKYENEIKEFKILNQENN